MPVAKGGRLGGARDAQCAIHGDTFLNELATGVMNGDLISESIQTPEHEPMIAKPCKLFTVSAIR